PPLPAPAAETVPPYLNFAPLDNAADVLSHSAAEYHKAYEHAIANGNTALASAPLTDVNALPLQAERTLLPAEGLPTRPCFKRQISTPGFNSGSPVQPIPAV